MGINTVEGKVDYKDIALEVLVIDPIKNHIFGQFRRRVGSDAILPEEENDDDFPFVHKDVLQIAVFNARRLSISDKDILLKLESKLVTAGFAEGSPGRRKANKMIMEEYEALMSEYPSKKQK